MLITRPLPPDTDLLAVHRLAPARYPLLLQSVAHGTAQARWDLLLLASGPSLRLDPDGITRDADGEVVDGGFLDALDARWRELRLPREEPRWPFRGGWALFLGYELAGQVEPVLRLPAAAGALPVACALRCPAAVLRDHATGECVALAERGHEALLERIAADSVAGYSLRVPAWRAPRTLHEDDGDAFVAGVARILGYLAAGDVFQVNLSRAWHARFDASPDPAALYARLRAVSPAPFSGLFADARCTVVSASPERLVSVRGDLVETRPIAGTRPRLEGDDDAARVRELAGHPKERAEHVMLVDLERNDLGRVCVPGSVEVDELMTVESYAQVHHIVSNVRGRLRAGATPGEVIAAVFPGGTITGCPKVRCMQIIAELEASGRGAYTGAMGWLNRDGDLDLNILIRSAEVEGDVLRFRTGAGIVADSDPLRELEETRAKARGMLRALGS
ncbi:aminodeoxychorismate synthase component I [Luteimonas salinilitoris]|uniref:Aminodeoxychorismate synthase component I n=1 Tax=Luteimonas salinilitoris TaxID=3237697 RepID=A0ABV4HKI9_9GAMM